MWDYIKEKNGWKSVTIPEIAVNETFLFDDEPDTEQGHTVVDIWDNNAGSILIEYIPEWTPVRSSSMFHRGMKGIRKKSLAVSV